LYGQVLNLPQQAKENPMEHSDFPKIFQTLLPIIVFILWAMFSNAGKKRKMRNFPSSQKRKPGPESDNPLDREKTSYHQAPNKEQENPDKTGYAVSSSLKATGHFSQHQPAMKISMPSDLHVNISSVHGAAEPKPGKDYGRYSLEELQKFVVWSEILNRPIALRDPE
jgi:hypothetical protein